MRNAFPIPYPDELLPSVMARFRYEYPAFYKKDIPATRRSRPLQYNRWGYELKQIEAVWSRILSLYPIHTIRQFAEEHTLYPLFKPFIAPKIWSEMHQQNDFWNYRVPKERLLPKDCIDVDMGMTYKLCPVCAQEDWWNHGCAYWHRIHNIWGVHVCLHHKVRLINSPYRLNEIETLLPAELFSDETELPIQPLSEEDVQDQFDLHIAQSMWWLINNGILLESGAVEQQYQRLYTAYQVDRYLDGNLLEWVWANCLPQISLQRYFPHTSSEHSPFFYNEQAHFFMRPTTDVPHPTIHIINWLAWGFTAEEFFAFDGDWASRSLKLTQARPCLNPECAHYKQNVITQAQIVKRERSNDTHYQKIGVHVYDPEVFLYGLECATCKLVYYRDLESRLHYEPDTPATQALE